MDTLTQSIIKLADNLKSASKELSISVLETENLFKLNDKLTSMEEELAVAKMLIAQERQIISGMKSKLTSIKEFFEGDENAPAVSSNSSTATIGKKSVKFGLQSNLTVSSPQTSSQFSQILAPLSIEEFEALPKYLRGRMTIDRVNAMIEELNKVFCEKYTLLKANPAKLPFDQRQRYYDWKGMESEDTKGRFFVTDTDLKGKSFRMDQTGRNILTLIRQAGRFKESRSAGIVRYISHC